jgi:hypothetical protein
MLPKDYMPGLGGLIFPGNPDEVIHQYSLRFRYTLLTTENQKVRLGLEGGPSLVNYDHAVFTKIPDSMVGWGSNYDMKYETLRNHSASIYARFEFLWGRFIGLDISLGINKSPYHTDFAGDIGIMVGILRKKIR